MSKNDERRSAGISVRSVCIGLIWAAAVAAALLLLGAVLISKEKLGENMGGAVICAASFAGTLAGGIAAGRNSGRAFLLSGITVGLLAFGLRSAAALLGGKAGAFGGFAMPILASMVSGGIFGGLMAGRRRKKRKKRV